MVNLGGFGTDLTRASAPTGHSTDGIDLQRECGTARRIGVDLSSWEGRMRELIEAGATIITFRGAGTINGILPVAEGKVVASIRDGITELRTQKIPVVLMYDGDEDNRAKPDIGSVFGQVADFFTKDKGVVVIAAQTEGWYSPLTPNAPITSANGTTFETYVFSDELPGAHASLTQSSQLVAYTNYSQVLVGPAGQIAFKQLQDLSNKAVTYRTSEQAPLRVSVFITPNNPAVGEQLALQMENAEGDMERVAKIKSKVDQRTEHPFGFLCTEQGEFNLEVQNYPGISFNLSKSN